MPRKKKPENNYFNSEVEAAVCEYINSDNQLTREKAFAVVYPAFSKIAEVMANKMNLSYYDTTREDLMADAVAFMVEKMDKFDCSAGKKAFSYFTVVCKHYLIFKNNSNHKYFRRYNPISEMEEGFDVVNEDIQRDFEKKEAAQLLEAFTNYIELNFNHIFTDFGKEFGHLVLEKLKNWEDIEDITRTKIFADIHQNSSYSRDKITKLMNHIQAHFNLFKKRWDTGNPSLEFIEKNSLTREEKEYVRLHYKPIRNNKRNSTGTVSLARKFGVQEYVIREYVKTFI